MDYKISIPSGKEKKKYLKEVSNYVEGVEDIFHKKSILRRLTTSFGECLANNEKVLFIIDEGRLIPSLHLLMSFQSKLKKITVDLGAIKFVMNGADIMRPGITHIQDGIQKGELIEIIEEKNGGTLAIGEAMSDSNDMQDTASGKVIKNIHHLKDQWWTLSLS